MQLAHVRECLTGEAHRAAQRKYKVKAEVKRVADANAKVEAEAECVEEERRAAVRARMAALLQCFGVREAFRTLHCLLQPALAEYEGRRVRAWAKRAFGALVRRRKAAIARAQRLLRRLGARHMWRQGAMMQLRQRMVERRVSRALRMLSRFVHSVQKRSWAARVSAAARPAMGSAKCEWLAPRGTCGSCMLQSGDTA